MREGETNMERLIRSGLEELGLRASLSPQAPRLLARYGQALLEKNQVMNLTAITQPEDVATLHMLDCACLLNCAHFQGKQLIDVGTGAGFPGMVLKLLVPSYRSPCWTACKSGWNGCPSYPSCGSSPVWRCCTSGRKRPDKPPISENALTLPPPGP